MTRSTSTPASSIFKIPFELRTAIYRYLFHDLSQQQNLTLCICCNSTAAFSSPPVAILATCHQLRYEALPFLLDSLPTKLVFEASRGPSHPLKCDHAPPTWILKQHGSLITQITFDAKRAGRLPVLLGFFPNLEKVTMIGYKGHLRNLQSPERNYFDTDEHDEYMFYHWDTYHRDVYEDAASQDWIRFLKGRQLGIRVFKLEAIVAFTSGYLGDMVVRFDLDTGEVVEKKLPYELEEEPEAE